jgi:hypothetical protein
MLAESRGFSAGADLLLFGSTRSRWRTVKIRDKKKSLGLRAVLAKVRKPMAPPSRAHPDVTRYSRPREKSRLRRGHR